MLERVDDAEEQFVDRHGIAGRLLEAGDRGLRRREADHFALQVQQRAAAGAEVELGVGLDERAEVMDRVLAIAGVVGVFVRGRLAREVGDDAPTGARLAVASDGVRIAEAR